MLDVLHLPNTTSICGFCARDGGGRVLAGRIDPENIVGEIQFLEEADGFGFVRIANHPKVTFVILTRTKIVL